jgi:hypothetical protein
MSSVYRQPHAVCSKGPCAYSPKFDEVLRSDKELMPLS